MSKTSIVQNNSSLSGVLDKLLQQNLAGAITEMDNFAAAYPAYADAEHMEPIRNDFQMMTDYWKRGYKDPQLKALYHRQLQRMYQLYADKTTSMTTNGSAFFTQVYMRIHLSARDLSLQVVRERLEAYVGELTLNDLEPEPRRQQQGKNLLRSHHEWMTVVFDYVWTSKQWSDGYAQAMEDILLSPTIDSRDQQLLVSGVTLGCLNMFDMMKLRTLVNVYKNATDENVRQRALVGWTLSLKGELAKAIYPEAITMVETLLENEQICRELVELQKQIVYCTNAERDTEILRQEIMPDLLKNQNLNITRNGIEEIEEDPLEGILHPDAEERRFEQAEESYMRMVDMHKQGSDIYFAGFSQMKRFSFFNTMSNWFVPFYQEHPDISQVMEQYGNNKLLRLMLTVSPFCNSDKYSFVLAYSQVASRLPKDIAEMMERGEAQINEMSKEELTSPAFIRRAYLQDLYRFYRLFSRNAELANPFASSAWLFTADPTFKSTQLEAYFNDLAAFLIKQKKYSSARSLLLNIGTARHDSRYWTMMGYLGEQEQNTTAFDDTITIVCYRRALNADPSNESALRGLARGQFRAHDYKEAIDTYDRLILLQPDKKSYQLNRAICLANMERYGEAEKVLFKMNYETPDDDNVNRVLAWTLTCDGKYEQAHRLYQQLMSGQPSNDDLLNFGYCLWFMGHIDEAADCFHRYIKETGDEAKDTIFSNEARLLSKKGISMPERQMMLYII